MPEAERRQLTVMFVDLVGSTALGAGSTPRRCGRPPGPTRTRSPGRWARFEGQVAKLMGDGVLSYFGWPRAHEDEAERAVRARARRGRGDRPAADTLGRNHAARGCPQPACRRDRGEPGADGALGLVLVRPGPPEVAEHTVAHQLGNLTLEARHLPRRPRSGRPGERRASPRIKPGAERRGPDEVNEHHGRLPPLGGRAPPSGQTGSPPRSSAAKPEGGTRPGSCPCRGSGPP